MNEPHEYGKQETPVRGEEAENTLKENIIDRLKVKEKEMEACIEEARRKASVIKAEAVKEAREIKAAGAKELEREIKTLSENSEGEITKEVLAIEARSEQEAELVRKRASEKIDSAIREVLRIVAEGIDDREDVKGPDNRA